ncbi:hypothetical protein GCM10017559_00220 [Streptosporangium longisporum]|uniref:Uncharacterized protein n=1 Tax=Streptosporangium longisporum TaxID=46187 RepID=A0ABN3XRM4_9ACTN
MQVGEEHLALAHPVVLLGDRFLDLQDQVPLGPHVVGRVHDGRAHVPEVGVGDGGPQPGVLLDEDPVAVPDELVRSGGRQGHAVLVVLDLAGN